MKSVVHGTAIALAIVGVVGLSGCSSFPAPNAKVASSEAAIRAAQETGSRDVPQAALHLKLAEEQLEQAKKLIRSDDNERASYVLARAEADAELALALSRAEGSKAKAGTALDNVRAVRSGAPNP
jgi:outer membrane murein-binding lipoprotein Lpp